MPFHLVVVTPGRHPYQVLVIAGIALASGALLIGGLVPRSMDALVDPPLVTAWKITLALGAVLVLVGTYWRGQLDRGLILEAGGHLMAAAMLTLFVVAAFVFSGWSAMAAGGFIGGIAAAGWLRACQVVYQLRKVRRAEAAGAVRPVPLLIDPDRKP